MRLLSVKIRGQARFPDLTEAVDCLQHMQTSSASSYVERSNAYLYAAMPRIIAVIVMLSYTRFAFFCLGCDSVLPKNCRLLLLIFYLCVDAFAKIR